MKCAQVDVEHIQTTDAFLSGYFASYHVYPYYPDYLYYVLNPIEVFEEDDISDMPISQGVPVEEVLTGDTQTDFLRQQRPGQYVLRLSETAQ